MRFILSAFLITSSLFLSAQVNLNFIDPNEQYNLAVEAYNNDAYKEAIELLKEINENDSIYRSSVVLNVQCWFYREKYQKVIELYKQHKHIKDDYFRQLSNLYGVALIRLEEYDNAEKFYQQQLTNFPNYYLYHYNLGKTYELTEKYDSAIYHYQKSIIYHAYYAPPHLALANMKYRNNQLAQALMGWDMYLLLEPTASNSINVLLHADKAVASKSKETPLAISEGADIQNFEEINTMLGNYIALNNNYKIPARVSAPFVKQNYALLELLTDFEGGDDFWSEKYVPLLQKIHSSGLFEPFAYRMIQSSSTKSHQKAVAKSKKEREDLVGWLQNEWPKILGYKNESDEGIRYFYSSNGELSAIGYADEELTYNGAFAFFENGSVSAKGNFTKDKRSGNWSWYDEFGRKKEDVVYDSVGVLNGKHIKYDTNGYIISQVIFDSAEYNGPYALYHNNYLKETGTYDNGKFIDSMVYYYGGGEEFPKALFSYRNDTLDGVVEKYYENGELKMKGVNKDDWRDGVEIHYYPNGDTSYVYQYKKGELHGSFISYYQSGQVHQTGKYSNDQTDSLWTTYYTDGTVSYQVSYKDDELHGPYIYSEYGSTTPTYEHEYYEGDIHSYKHYMDDGSLINQSERPSSGDFNFESFYSNGLLRTIGTFDKDGNRIGNWKYYDAYGNLESSEYYVDGLIDGNDTSFYSNGNIYNITPYENGIMSGVLKSFYIDGSLMSMGSYKNDEQHRLWYYFYPDGTLKEQDYYKNGLPHGYQYRYGVDGKLVEIIKAYEGDLIYGHYCDTLGQVYTKINYLADTMGILTFADSTKQTLYRLKNGLEHGNKKWFYHNGQLNTEGNYVLGQEHGSWKAYHENGQLKESGSYVYGDPVGEWIEYHENGAIHEQYTYNEDLNIDGTFNTYSDKGVLTYAIQYAEGLANGKARYFSNTGELQMIRYYKNDIVTGYSYLDSNKNQLPPIEIEGGSAKVKTFYSNGNPAREYTFVNGKFHGPYIHYYPDGTIESKEIYFYGYKKGEAMTYFDDGTPKIQCYYLLDELHGEYIEYYENGKIKKKEQYLNGKLDGLSEYYNSDTSIDKKVWHFNGEVYGIVKN